MSDNSVKDFLEKIGDRPLTEAEVKELHLLKIKAGEVGGFLSLINELEDIEKSN
mgnify:CR=1 FL=1